MNKSIKFAIHFLIIASLISNSAYWALGDINYLAPKDSLPSIAGEFHDEATSLSIVKNTVKWGITSNKDLEESIWKALFNNRYERLFEIGYFSGERCLIFNGALYIFSRDRPVIYRFSRKKGIDDPFGKIIEGYKGELTKRRIGGRLYYRQSFIVTEENLEFINSCIQTLYPEWDFRCRIPKGGGLPRETSGPTKGQPVVVSRAPNRLFLFTMLFILLFQSFCGKRIPPPQEVIDRVVEKVNPQVYPPISIDMFEDILFHDLDFLDKNVRGRLLKVLYILTYQEIPTIKELDSFSIRDAIFRSFALGTPEEIGEELFYAIYTLSDDSTDKGRTAKLIGYKYTKEDLEAAQKPLDYERFKEICDYFGIPYDIVLSIWFIETEGFNRLAVNTYGKKKRDVYDEGLAQIKHKYAIRFWTGEADDLKVPLDKELPGWTDRDKKKKDYNPFDWKKNLMVQCAMLNHLYHRLEKFCTKDGKLMIERDELWRLVIICYHLGENGLIRKAVRAAMDVASKEGRLVTIGDILKNIKPEKYRKRAVYYESNTCSVRRSIGNLEVTGGNILKWEGVTDKERSGIRDRIIKKIFRRQKRKDNDFVSGKVRVIIPVINSAITGIKPELMGETLERAILGLFTNAKKQGILTERKARLILGELKSLGDWAKSMKLAEFLSIAVDKLENSGKIGFRGFVEKDDRFFLGGSVNRKGKDYLLYDVDFLRHLLGLGKGSEYLVSEYFFHEAMEFVCGKHQISRLLALLLFPQNYSHISEDRKVYFPYLRRDIRTFVTLNTFASEYFPRRGFWDWIKRVFKVGIILFIPSIAYGKGFGVYLVAGLQSVFILVGILGIVLLFIIIPRYIRHIKNENIKRGIVEIIEKAIKLYPPGEMGQCMGASEYVKGRIDDEFPALETKSIQCYIPLSPNKTFYPIGETGETHFTTEVRIGGERYIVDTQLKQFAEEWDLPEGFVNKCIYPWDEYFLAIPVYADKGCRERILPDNLVNITKNFWAWAESHSARETTVEEANDYLYSIVDEWLHISRNGIKAIYQETILKYFAEERRKLAESLGLAAMDYKELGMDLDSAMCDEHAGKIYFKLVYKEDAIRALNHASKGYSRLGRYGKAGECCEYIARICELFEDKQGEARAWALAGGNYYRNGVFKKAAECDKKAASIDEQLGSIRSAVKGWDLARKNYLSVEMEEEIAECLENIARLDEEIGDRAEQEERYRRYRTAINGYKELALIYYRQGRYSKAGVYSSRAARVQEKAGLKKDVAKSWSLAANSYQLAEEFKMAGDCYFNAGRIDRELGAIRGAIKTFSLAVECYRKAGEDDKVRMVQEMIDETKRAPITTRGFLINKDKPGEFTTDTPEVLKAALKRLVDKYGPGIVIPVEGVRLDQGTSRGEVILDDKWIKISSGDLGDSEAIFSVLEKGFLQRIIFIICGDRDKLNEAMEVYNNLIMARNAVDLEKRQKIEWKIKLILSGLSLGQLRLMTVLKDYKGLPPAIGRAQPMYMRLDIDKIDEECLGAIKDLMKYRMDGIKFEEPVPPDERLFLFSFYSSSGGDVEGWLDKHKLKQDNIEWIGRGITLLSPENLLAESKAPKDKMYLLFSYSKKSILMAADIILNYENLEHTEVYSVIKVLYRELVGEEPKKEDILRFLTSPWAILPKPEAILEFFNGISKAEEILMSSA